MIDVQQVRELAELMTENGLTEVRVRQGDAVVVLRKGPSGEPSAWAMSMPMMQPGVLPAPVGPAAQPAPAAAPAAGGDEGLVPIVSPMVGTYYSSPDPESGPFVSAGMDIEVGTPVCIIEAMKVFNEIKSEVAGRIERILVRNEQAVEYGQPLMMVRPR
ncbi:MAG: acetyl-CoA carboxylase, biotin carboxyl carrier protein [Phycisphaerae bacterium]